MKNRFTLNESERERILKLHEDEKPGIINRVKGAIQGFKQPQQVLQQTTQTKEQPVVSANTSTSAATDTSTSTATNTSTSATTSATTSAATSSWATSADNSTVCQTKPSKTKSPQVQQVQAILNKVFVPKPESKTIKDCKGGILFPIKEDGVFGANTAKAVLIAMNYKKLSGGQQPQGQQQQGQQPQGQQGQQGQQPQGQQGQQPQGLSNPTIASTNAGGPETNLADL
jgi:guanyl-specific ribonuclease Sa